MKIDMKQPILQKNDSIAAELRARFAENHVYVVDLLASPGSGKTSTLLASYRYGEMMDALRDEFNIAVIEGDIASSVDAEKIKAQGTAAVQINTGGACHLESAMIKRAVDVLDLERLDLIIIENVGNLVCTVDFDLGESLRAMEELVKKAGGNIVGKMAVLAEGGAIERHDITVLAPLPLFNPDGTLKN